MKKLATFTLTALLSFHALSQEIQGIVDKGYRLSNESVTKNFSVMRLPLEEKELIKHIIKTNYKVDPFTAREIAHNILKTSVCFRIDPWILASLIKKESSFQKNAISPTGAVGLTQFTGLGLKEVNDQLGFRGKAGATEIAIAYFTSRIRECADSNWVDLWIKIGLAEDHPDFYNLLKEEVKNDIPTAIIYGSILLKTYLGYIDNKATLTETPLPLSETYYQALQIYNGEEGDRKVNYAKAVFKNLKEFYPREVNFPFLIDTP